MRKFLRFGRCICIFAFTLILSPHSEGESGSVALQSAKSLVQYDHEANQICQRIKVNPYCAQTLDLMQKTLGLSVAACQARKSAAHCDRFFAKFPEFRSHEMSCEPYNVCEEAMGSTGAGGCISYGIKMKDSVVDMLQKEGTCVSQISCAGRQLFLALIAITNPLEPEIVASKMAKQTLDQINADQKKFESTACLDAETQMEFGCYLMVNYGGAVLGSEGAAVRGASLMMRMEKLATAVAKAQFKEAVPEGARVITRALESSSLPEVTTEHVRAAHTLSQAKLSYLEKLIQLKKEGKLSSKSDLDYWLNNPDRGSLKTETVNPDPGERPFRGSKTASLLPNSVTPNEIYEAFANLKDKKPIATNSSGAVAYDKYRFEYKGNVYQVAICKTETCKVAGGLVQKNQPASLFPVCGPEVKFLVSRSQAKQIFLENPSPTLDSFLQSAPCE